VVEVRKPRCILITESWLHDRIPDSLVNIPNYALYRADGVLSPGYDGVCVYLHDSITSRFKIRTYTIDSPGIDNLFIDMTSGELSLLLGCIYRPRATDSDYLLFDHLLQISQERKYVLIAGDFNLPEIRWPIDRVNANDNSPAGYLRQTVQNSSLSQLITQPTRFRLNQRPSVLDLVFTNDESSVSALEYLPPLNKSDHVVLDIRLQFSVQTTPRRMEKHITKVNYSKANEDLLRVDWTTEFQLQDVNSMWCTFKTKLQTVLTGNSSSKVVYYSVRKPWMNDTLIRLCRRKKSLWQRFRRSNSRTDFVSHREFSNTLSRMMVRARTEYENRIAASPNKKLFFKAVRSKLQNKVTIPLLQRSPGVLCTSAEEVAVEFARSFAAVYSEEPSGCLPALTVPAGVGSCASVSFSPEKVKSLLSKLNIDVAPGPDGISSRVLKYCCDGLAVPLSMLMTSSFVRHTLPDDWLTGTVTPIYKKGNKLIPSNYRPITLTSLVCKLTERVIHAEILEFAKRNHIIPAQQHGFVPGRSVITNLLSCVDEWTKSNDRGSPVDVIYLDFAKAFDRVPRRRLLYKLQCYGIRGDLLKWIEAYLSDRSFCVKVGSTLSEPESVSSGVPQGSTLGPLLFLIYTADLANVIKSNCAFYADDVKIYGDPLDPDSSLVSDLVLIQQWCDKWLIPVNPSKCSVMHIGRSNPKRQYVIGGTILAAVNTQRDLGVVISSDLSWSAHIQHIAGKANKMLYLIRKAFPNCGVGNLGQFYKTYIRPILEYAGPVWHPTLQRDIALLESIQRRSTRLTLGTNRPPYEERLKMCRLTSYSDRKLRGDLIITFRALHEFFGCDMAFLFPLNVNNLRGHNFKLKKENFSTTARQCFLSNRIFERWNALPQEVVNATSVNSFKNEYDRCVVRA